MANPKFYIGDLEEVTFTMSETENASFPLSNLSTYLPSLLPWKSSTTALYQTLKIDFGSAKTRNFLAIANHNLVASAGDIETILQADDNSGFTSPADIVNNLEIVSTDPYIVTFNAVSYRYWRIIWQSSTPLGAAPQIGMIFINQEFDAGFSYELPGRLKNESFQTTSERSLSGLLRTAQNYKGVLTFEFGFKNMNDTFESTWLRFHQKVRGSGLPFYYVDPNAGTWLLHLDQDSNELDKFRYNLNHLNRIRMLSQGVHQNPLT